MLQTHTFEITRNHQNNAAKSFQVIASPFVPSCIEKLTSERKVAFRSLLVQVPESSGSAWACGAFSISTCKGLTRGEEFEEGGERALLYVGALPLWAHFSTFLGGVKIDANMVPKK